MRNGKPSCWIEVDTSDRRTIEEVERELGALCEGVPVLRYDPETDKEYEACGLCGARRPEKKRDNNDV